MRSPGYVPGPLVIADTVEVVLAWQGAFGQRVSNVLHATNNVPVAVNSSLANTLFDAIVADAAWTAYAAVLNVACQFTNVKVRDLNTAGQPQFVSTSAAAPGTATTNPTPGGVALVGTYKTAVSGRAGRGRIYLQGFDVDGVDSLGHATSTVLTASSDFLNLVNATLASNSLIQAIAHRGHAEYISPSTGATVPGQAPGRDQIISILIEDSVFDSQRRRK